MAHFRSLQEPESIKGKTSYKSVVVEGERIQPAMSSQAKLEWNFKWHFMEKKQTDGLKCVLEKKGLPTLHLFPLSFKVWKWKTLNSPTKNIFLTLKSTFMDH